MNNLQVGMLVGGRYEIVRPLGTGGMGAVYLARDPQYENFYVALKVLYPNIVRSAEARARFRTEINAVFRVSHENVVQGFEFFDDEEIFAYAMEYVDGGDLLTKIQRGKLGADEAISVLFQTASGLHAIHQEGIIHRDLKPENILLTRRGSAKISDFGVARISEGMGLTQHGSLVGTPKYVAPEYIEAGECDHRGDIFALGVMAYEMVTGTSPYKSSNERALLRERFTVSTGDLERLAPQCPAELFRFIRKAMSVSVNERYQSAVEVMEELERIRTLRDKVLFEESEAPAPREEPVPESAVVSGSLRVETPAVTKRQWLTMAGSVVAILGALAGAALSR